MATDEKQIAAGAGDPQHSAAGMTTRVVKGSLWTLLGQVAPLAVSLAATPFTIRLLGAEGYGVLILVGLIPAYLAFADFGMSLASTRFASEAFGRGDRKEEAAVIRTAVAVALSISVPVALGLIIFAPQIISLFAVPENLFAEAVAALRITAVTFVVNILCGILNTPQLARLRMDLNTLINAGTRIAGLIATPVAIYLGFGIVGAAAVLLAAMLLNLAGHVFFSGRLLPELFGLGISREKLRPLLKFGAGLVVSSFAAVGLVNAEKGILAGVVSASALAHYTVAFTAATMMTLFAGAMIQSLIPAFSQLQGEEARERLNGLFERGVRLSMIWAVPAMIFLGVTAKPFFTIWAGEEFGRESTLPLYLLLGGLLFNIIAYLPHAAILAAGRSDALAKLYWIELVPYAAAVWLLASRYGAAGAAAAWSLRVIIDTFLQFYLAIRLGGITFRPRFPLGYLAGVAAAALPAVFMLYTDSHTLFPILAVLAGLIIYAALTLRTLVTPEERTYLTARLSNLTRRAT